MFQLFPLFRLMGIRFYADLSILMLVFFARDAWSFLALLITIILHELGHALVARGSGAYVEGIVLQGFGGVTQWSGYLSAGRKALVSVAGPAVNLLTAAPLFTDWTIESPLLLSLMHWSLVLGIFNLLPVLPLDGGHILENLLALKWSQRSARIATLHVTRIGCLMLILAVLMWRSSDVFLLVFSAIFLFQAHRELGELGSQGIPWFKVKPRAPRPSILSADDEKEVREKVDALLAKISEKGMSSLSDKERTFLKEASRRFR